MNTNTKRSTFCPSCSTPLIRWGRNRSGTVRYRCRHCKTTTTAHHSRTKRRLSHIRLFEYYILRGMTYATLSSWSKIPVPTLIRVFHTFLDTQPPPLPIPQTHQEESYLLLDGKWFGKKEVVMLYRESTHKTILHASFMKKEWGSLIAKDLQYLKDQGYRFTCIVSDGGTGIKKAVFKIHRTIPHQICLAHVHRQCIAALGKYPKDEAKQDLRRFADHLWLIESKEALQWWRGQLQQCVKTHSEYLKQTRWDTKGTWWYVHKGARKAVKTLTSAPEFSFKFLDHPLLPKTTNAVEGQISNLSMKHLIHRGLKHERTHSFLRWFIYFYNRNLLSQRK